MCRLQGRKPEGFGRLDDLGVDVDADEGVVGVVAADEFVEADAYQAIEDRSCREWTSRRMITSVSVTR